MKVSHKNAKLARIEAEESYNAEGLYSNAIVRGFRKAMGYLRNAADERDMRNHQSLHYEKLQPPRDHQRSIKVSDQFRLILEWEGTGESRTVVVVGIEDYH